MFLKKSIVLINVIHYFAVVTSVRLQMFPGNQHELETNYLVKIVLEKKNRYEYKICQTNAAFEDMRNSIVATMCKSTMDMLRVVTNDYGDNVYVNYHSFKTESEIFCKDQFLQMTTESTKVIQKMISCHNRPAIIDADTLNSDNELKVHIFPTNELNKSWLVFDCMGKGQEPCILKSWFTNYDSWENFVPKMLFILPPPTSITTVHSIHSDLLDFYKKWNIVTENEGHVLHRVDVNSFSILCNYIIGKAKRESNFGTSKPSPTVNMLFFSIPKTNSENIALDGLSYSCDDFITIKGLSLFVGHGDSTVILAQRVLNTKNYKIIKIVKNLYPQYLHYIF